VLISSLSKVAAAFAPRVYDLLLACLVLQWPTERAYLESHRDAWVPNLWSLVFFSTQLRMLQLYEEKILQIANLAKTGGFKVQVAGQGTTRGPVPFFTLESGWCEKMTTPKKRGRLD
jgi:hypothetical protein